MIVINIDTKNKIIRVYTKSKIDNGGAGSGIKGHHTNREDKTNIITIKGNELDNYKNIKELRQRAKEYYKHNIQGSVVERNDIGKIKFSRRGIEETIYQAKDDIEALQLIPYLPQIIKTATILNKEMPNHKRKDKVDHFISLINNININGKNKNVEVLLKHEDGYWHYCLYLNKDRISKESCQDSQNKSGLNNSHDSIINNNYKKVNKYKLKFF